MIKSRKNKAVAITSYCDTEEKLNVLIVNISQLRSFFPEYDIVLHANHPLDHHVQKLVDTYIYEDLNHVDNDKWIYYWNIITDGKENGELLFNKKFYYSIKDSGYSVYQQIRALTEYLVSYNRVLLINYDTKVEDIKKDDYNENYDLFVHRFPNQDAYSLIIMEFNPKEFRRVTDNFNFENWNLPHRINQLNEERFFDIVHESKISFFVHEYKVDDRIDNRPDYNKPNIPNNQYFTNYILCYENKILEVYLWGKKSKDIMSIKVRNEKNGVYQLINQNTMAFESTTRTLGEVFNKLEIVEINNNRLPSPISLKLKTGNSYYEARNLDN